MLRKKIQYKLLRWQLQPIHVFCFHQVSDVYNPLTTWKCDWTQMELFKQRILSLKKEYEFISLSDAYEHLLKDRIRLKKYAVLTNDDGMQCLSAVVPWLESENIPITLFISAKYLDGKSYYKGYEPYWKAQGASIPAVPQESLYLSYNQLQKLQSRKVEIAIHGWEHVEVASLSQTEFEQQTILAIETLQSYLRYIPFYAFTYGKLNRVSLEWLKKSNLIPVLCDGKTNIKFDGYIHRECIDGDRKVLI